MPDYTKRDTKIVRKLEEIIAAPQDRQYRLATQALKALYSLGIQHTRDELGWCSQCEGRGYKERAIQTNPFSNCAEWLVYKKAFCTCQRGEELKAVYEELNPSYIPKPKPLFRRQSKG